MKVCKQKWGGWAKLLCNVCFFLQCSKVLANGREQKTATGKKIKTQPLSWLCHSCSKKPPATFRLDNLHSRTWHWPLPVHRNVLQWDMKESVYAGDRETRPCDLQALMEDTVHMVNSPMCWRCSESLCRWRGGRVPGTCNLEEGAEVSVFLSAFWFLLTIRKSCWSVPCRLAAPGDPLQSWWSSRGPFFGIGQNVLCVDSSLLCPGGPRWGGAQCTESICSNRPRKTIFKTSTQRTSVLCFLLPLLSTLE